MDRLGVAMGVPVLLESDDDRLGPALFCCLTRSDACRCGGCFLESDDWRGGGCLSLEDWRSGGVRRVVELELELGSIVDAVFGVSERGGGASLTGNLVFRTSLPFLGIQAFHELASGGAFPRLAVHTKTWILAWEELGSSGGAGVAEVVALFLFFLGVRVVVAALLKARRGDFPARGDLLPVSVDLRGRGDLWLGRSGDKSCCCCCCCFCCLMRGFPLVVLVRGRGDLLATALCCRRCCCFEGNEEEEETTVVL